MIRAMYANLKRPPRTVTDWLADAVRATAIVLVLVSLFTLPFTDFAEFEKDPTVEKANSILTVDTIVNYVESKLKAA